MLRGVYARAKAEKKLPIKTKIVIKKKRKIPAIPAPMTEEQLTKVAVLGKRIWSMQKAAEFETKDSGERIEFPSGMQRDTHNGKMLWHLVASGPMLERWAGLLTRGAIKYSEDNWMKANSIAEKDRFRASAFRHFMQWYYGVEDGEDHGAAVIFNINGVEYVKGKIEKS